MPHMVPMCWDQLACGTCREQHVCYDPGNVAHPTLTTAAAVYVTGLS